MTIANVWFLFGWKQHLDRHKGIDDRIEDNKKGLDNKLESIQGQIGDIKVVAARAPSREDFEVMESRLEKKIDELTRKSDELTKMFYMSMTDKQRENYDSHK